MTSDFRRTHPWISFSVDLTRAPATLWLRLGEARSKCEHIAGAPLRPVVAAELHRVYLAKGALATTAIEGNTLSEEEARAVLDGTLNLPPSREYLAQEVENILSAYNLILSEIQDRKSKPISSEAIRLFNEMVLRELEVGEGVVPGQYREHQVGVARYRAVPPEDCEELVQSLCAWLNGSDFVPQPDSELVYGIIKAILAHLYLAWIHPFGDGNGRTARLVEFQILVGCGVPTPAALLLSNHYNQTRTEYYRQLDRASQSGGDIIPFLEYAVQGFVDGLRAQLDVIREQQWDVTWRNYIHEAFKDKTTAADIRRRRLVLDLSASREPVEKDRLAEVSPRIAREYAKKTRKALSRDLNVLLEMGLVRRVKGGYLACRETILAFLPERAEIPSSTLDQSLKKILGEAE